MSEWRVIPGLEKEIIRRSTFAETDLPGLTVGEAFPDAYRMPIAARLREWGIDVRDVIIGGIMFSASLGETNPITGEIIIRVYEDFGPLLTDVQKYLTLSHEFAHLLQLVEGRVDMPPPPYETIHDWISFPHEADAIRWGARQAKVMGISEGEYMKIVRGPFIKAQSEHRAIVHPVFAGTWPEEHGVRPMFPGGKPFLELKKKRTRKPVRVVRHRRRR